MTIDRARAIELIQNALQKPEFNVDSVEPVMNSVGLSYNSICDLDDDKLYVVSALIDAMYPLLLETPITQQIISGRVITREMLFPIYESVGNAEFCSKIQQLEISSNRLICEMGRRSIMAFLRTNSGWKCGTVKYHLNFISRYAKVEMKTFSIFSSIDVGKLVDWREIDTRPRIKENLFKDEIELGNILDNTFYPIESKTYDNAIRMCEWLIYRGIPIEDVLSLPASAYDTETNTILYNGEKIQLGDQEKRIARVWNNNKYALVVSVARADRLMPYYDPSLFIKYYDRLDVSKFRNKIGQKIYKENAGKQILPTNLESVSKFQAALRAEKEGKSINSILYGNCHPRYYPMELEDFLRWKDVFYGGWNGKNDKSLDEFDLIYRRNQRDMSLEDLSVATGFSVDQLSKWEQMEDYPNTEQQAILNRVLADPGEI